MIENLKIGIELSTDESQSLIAILAIIVSVIALVWNIVRDLIIDRTRLDIKIGIGDMFLIEGSSNKFLFREIDSKFIPESTLKVNITITNIGRHPMVVSKIWGTYKVQQVEDLPNWIFTAVSLPKLIQPYETINEISTDSDLVKKILEQAIQEVWVEDTKGKKWKMSKEAKKSLAKSVAVYNKRISSPKKAA